MPYFRAQEGLLARRSTPPSTIYGSTHTEHLLTLATEFEFDFHDSAHNHASASTYVLRPPF